MEEPSPVGAQEQSAVGAQEPDEEPAPARDGVVRGVRCLHALDENSVTLSIIHLAVSGTIMTRRGHLLPEFQSLMRLPAVTPMLELCLQGLCRFTQTLTGEDSWASSGLKDFSRLGYDVYKNGIIDYGNFQMTVLVHLACMQAPNVCLLLRQMSETFGSLSPDHGGTPTALSMKGDIMRVCHACMSCVLFDCMCAAIWLKSF